MLHSTSPNINIHRKLIAPMNKMTKTTECVALIVYFRYYKRFDLLYLNKTACRNLQSHLHRLDVIRDNRFYSVCQIRSELC